MPTDNAVSSVAKPATPLPWQQERTSKILGQSPAGDHKVAVANVLGSETPNAQNAAYIVKACNAYPRLLAERAALVEALRQNCAAFQSAYLRGVEIQNAEKRGSRAALAGLEMSRYAADGEKDARALLSRIGAAK